MYIFEEKYKFVLLHLFYHNIMIIDFIHLSLLSI